MSAMVASMLRGLVRSTISCSLQGGPGHNKRKQDDELQGLFPQFRKRLGILHCSLQGGPDHNKRKQEDELTHLFPHFSTRLGILHCSLQGAPEHSKRKQGM